MKKKNLKKFELNKTNVSNVTNHVTGGVQSTVPTTSTLTIEATTDLVTFAFCDEKSSPNTRCHCNG
jgi:hypothetical protein